MPCSTRSTIANEPVDVNFAYFLAKPFVAWHPFVAGVHDWMHTCSVAHASWQREWFSFLERRLHADAAQMKRLNTLPAEEAWSACYEFYQKTVEDYRTEYGQLAALGTNLLNESLTGPMKTLQAVVPQSVIGANGAEHAAAKAADTKVSALATA